MIRSCAVDRRRLVWVTVFVTALIAVISLAWNFAIPSGHTAAAPAAGSSDASSDDSAPAGPSLTSETDDGEESTTTYDSYTTVTRSPDTEEDGAPVPLAASGSVPRTTGTAASPTTVPSCIDALTGNTARCVTTTAPGPGATGGVCDTSVDRTTAPGCTGGTAFPTTTTSIEIDPCAAMTTAGCPAGTTATVPTTAPPFTTAPPHTTAPPVTCFPSCPTTTRAVP